MKENSWGPYDENISMKINEPIVNKKVYWMFILAIWDSIFLERLLQVHLNPSNTKATFVQSTRMQRFLITIYTLSCWYSSDSSRRELLDKDSFARVSIIFQDSCHILYWPNEPTTSLGLTHFHSEQLKSPDDFEYIFLTKAFFWKYLKEKCSLETK